MRECSANNAWSNVDLARRCRRVAAVAAVIADQADEWIRLAASPQRTDPVETISAELLPLCSALRFIGRDGPKWLRTRRLGSIGRPPWLWGLRSHIRREPYGTVLVLGAWNYPLFLAGTQVAQALAAGNRVVLKPAAGCELISDHLARAFHDCGVPESALRVLGSSVECAIGAIDEGVDLIVLTGSAATGRAVLRRAAETLTPTIMELSGCDAVVILPGADLDRASDAIAFGLPFNGGATCIGPRRLIVEASQAEAIVGRVAESLYRSPAVQVHPSARLSVVNLVETSLACGAVDRLQRFDAHRLRADGYMAPLLLDHVKPDDEIAQADLFAPVLSVIRVNEISAAAEIVNGCRYRLSASVFGPRAAAQSLASQLKVGSIAVNDLMVPTADPRVPFGGLAHSGFGVTRGGEGLLAMTVPVVTGVRRGRFVPHLWPRQSSDAQTLLGALQLLHSGSLRGRWSGVKRIRNARQSPGEEIRPMDEARRMVEDKSR